ncbi:hypothetical protein MGG_02226 [Pyricularia oryzae 70-15]|uniref:Zn(2)-C6 fungal-type domain-containing protein n=1 Tax=Pyricularia oryzae (strain 70-15 / ATCC MYA-4617 / FGSC 8958) TaxID=242507 RepID=G4MPN1_PYRO7|nr:uncharacterized protein MGG_02226 [Pyricularia oryzae 70-15]EHA56380.1 hypothetical protein MGG_02226 [Pyricularia oryzae 70-15]
MSASGPDYEADPQDLGRPRKRLRTANDVPPEATSSSYTGVRSTIEATPSNPRRAPKASRACDTCKAKKARCSGTMPCTRCAERGLACLYDARYSRGRPPTPPPGPSPTPPPVHHTAVRTPLATTTQPVPRTDGLSSVPGRSAASPSPSTGRSVAAATGNYMMPTQLPPIAPTDASSDDPGPSDIPPPYSAALDPTASESVTRRGSPELYPAEIGGQYVEQTSGLAFLHRAHVRMISKSGTAERDGAALGSTMGTSSAEGLYPSYGVQAGSSSQLLITAGDKPILASSSLPVQVVSGRSDGDGGNLLLPQRATSLMAFYFDKCVVTYRILHRQSVEGWLRAMELELGHVPPSGTTSFPAIGGAKAAVVLTVLAIAIQKRARMSLHGTPGRDGSRDEDEVLRDCDPYFSMAQSLVQAETGLPKLESAQARLLQVLYLLQTSRVNQAWYLLGTVSQLISALGLHRKPSRNSRPGPQRLRTDYIQQQCGRRTFWVLYTIDVYLSVVLGRPRYLHDDNIDQAYPDSVADENMTPDGERNKGRTSMDDIGCDDSPMEAVVQHAKLGRIIAATCREVYAIGPTPSRRDRLRLALGFDVRLHEWRAALPPLLGAVRPSSLVPSFRRQAVALRLAHAHAIMHATRPFLLLSRGGDGAGRTPEHEQRREMVSKCLRAAGTVLELVDSIAGDESLFHAFWWSHYVTFCAIAVTFVWEIQQASASGSRPDEISPGPLDPGAAEQLFVLAERCHAHLSRVLFADSFGRRYTVILEELRLEARHQSAKSTPAVAGTNGNVPVVMQADSVPGADVDNVMVSSGDYNADRGGEQGLAGGFNDWAPIDWLELDAAAFPYLDMPVQC